MTRAHAWILALSVAALLALIGMNLVSMNRLQVQQSESERESWRIQLDEFASQVRFDLIEPLLPLWREDLDELEREFRLDARFPQESFQALREAAANPIYSGIYFTPDNVDPCSDESGRLYRFDGASQRFAPISVESAPQAVCDAILNSRTRARVLVEGADNYQWNAKISYDTQRSLTLAFLDIHKKTVTGHLTFVLDEERFLQDYMIPRIHERFGPGSGSTIAVWLRDWTSQEILASSHPGIAYDPEQLPIDIRQGFPDFLDYWTLHASFIQPAEAAGGAVAWYRNLFILGLSGLVLVVGLVSMFRAAWKEKALSHRQSEFLANVTHELKTPLAVMQAAGENIADGRVSDAGRLHAYGDHIHRESLRLRSMIDKLLDVARTDAQGVQAKPIPTDPSRMVREILSEHRSQLDQAGIRVDLQLGEALPMIRIDPEHLRIILGNLLDNAVKYAGDGQRIVVRGDVRQGQVELAVQDFGMGIPKHAQKRIFEKFYRVEDTLTAKTRGHGLGLSIVKKLASANHGSVGVRSVPGGGSTFTVSFPVAMIDEPIGQRAVEHPATGSVRRQPLEASA